MASKKAIHKAKTEGQASLAASIDELEGRLKRALADYQNLERRVEEERKLLGQLTSVILIEKFLPVLDNLENAQKHLGDQGLEMVIKQFGDILISEGVEEISAEGAEFDPNLHEATEVIEGESDNRVVKVVRKGYKINSKVIRPAQVVVGRERDSGQALRLRSGQARMTETNHPRAGEDQILDPFDQTQDKQVENDTEGSQI